MTRSVLILLALAMLGAVVVINYLFALAGNPESVWLMRDVLGVSL